MVIPSRDDTALMKKLRTKFFLYILFPVVVIIAATGTASFFIARGIVLPQLHTLGVLGLQQAADEIDTTLGTGIEVLSIVAVEEGVENFSDEQLRAFFQKIRKNTWERRHISLESIFMGLEDGRFVSTVDRSEIPKDYEPLSQLWFVKALGSETAVVTPPQVSPFTGELVYSVSQRVTSSKGNIIGVLGYSVPVSALRSVMRNVAVAQQIEETIFSIFLQDGRYIVHSSDEKIGGRLRGSGDDLHIRMRQALDEDKSTWQSIGQVDGEWWFGGFQKSRYSGVYVALEIPLFVALSPLYRLACAYVGLGLASLLLLSLVLMKMTRKIAEPVAMLSRAAARLSRGDYEQKVPVITQDELGRLTEAFNSMIEGLRQRDFIRDTFGRYVSQEVANRLLETEDGLKLGGENRTISIVMSDLRGFTALTANMPPERVIHLLNRYLGNMVEILLDHQAIVDEMEGDGILAFFGAPEPMEDHAVQAVACALAMQSAMDKINSSNQAEGLPRLEMAIAINTGNVVVGNIGSERRTKYGAVGAEVNFTARIESYALGGQILVSHSTYERIRGIVKVRDVIQVEMKGIQGEVNLYDVHGLIAPYNVTLPDATETPHILTESIPVQIRCVERKVVSPVQGTGWVTHLSETSAVIRSEAVMQPHDEIRMAVLDEELEVMPGEAFARVVTVETAGNWYEAAVRFTFLSPEIRRMFRRRSTEQ